MHKVSQHMQNTIAQHQQRREKVTWNPQLHCALSSSKIPRQSGDARNRRARACQLFSGRVPLSTRKNTMFRADPNIQIADSALLYAALLYSALLYFALLSPSLLYTRLYSALFYSSLFFFLLLCYTLLCSTTEFYATPTPPLLHLYSTSTPPLLYLYSTCTLPLPLPLPLPLETLLCSTLL